MNDVGGTDHYLLEDRRRNHIVNEVVLRLIVNYFLLLSLNYVQIDLSLYIISLNHKLHCLLLAGDLVFRVSDMGCLIVSQLVSVDSLTWI